MTIISYKFPTKFRLKLGKNRPLGKICAGDDE